MSPDETSWKVGAEYAGVLVRDGWAPYRRFRQAGHQTCVGHLVRRCRELGIDYPRAAWPQQVQHILQQALRPAVVNRKVPSGNRSPRGADAHQILASVVHTARLRRLDTREVLADLLRARQPIVSPALNLPRQT